MRAGGHGDARIAGDGRRRRAGAEKVIAVDADRSATPGCRSARRSRRAAGASCTASMPSARARAGTSPARRGTRASVSGPFFSADRKSSWPKNGISRAFSRSLKAMRSASERTVAVGPQRRQVVVQPGLELVEQDLELAVVDLRRRRDVGGIDDHRAVRLHVGDRLVDQRDRRRGCSRRTLARDADARALERAGVEALRVVAGARDGGFRRRVARDRRRPATASSAAASATVRAIGPAVSCVCEIGMMPDAAHQADRRLDADQAVDRRRTDDRAVGLGADADRREVGRDGRAGAGARAARVAIERVRVLASGRRGRSSRSRTASSGSWPTRSGSSCRGSPRRPRAAARRRRRRAARSTLRAPASRPSSIMRSAVSMLSLISTGMPCSGPRGPLRLAFGVERVGDRQRVGIDLDDRTAAPDRRDRSARCARGRARRAAAPCSVRACIHSWSCAIVASSSANVAGWPAGALPCTRQSARAISAVT